MSRFRFRGWWPDHEEGRYSVKRFVPGCMYDHNELFVYGEFRLGIHGSIDRICGPDGETWGEGTGIVLMQSTGLFDKNGKEIFEGDIIRDLQCPCCVAPIEWDEEGARFCWDHGAEWGMLPERKNIEVIGNIYENPELLKP